MLIAHRGSSRHYPENTFAAFDAALRAGCDGIELDVQLSRDGVPVVYHDRTLTRAGGGRKRVGALDAAELTRLDPGGRFERRFRGETIPTLDAVLRRYGRRTRLLVELKARERDRIAGTHRALAAAVAASLRRSRLVRRVFVLSFDAETLDLVRAGAEGASLVLNVRRARRLGRGLRERLDSLFALSLDVRGLSPAVVRAAQERGRPVLTYTCNTPAALERALDAGVDAIMSDRPEWLRQAIEARP